jgi:hypothetical protein
LPRSCPALTPFTTTHAHCTHTRTRTRARSTVYKLNVHDNRRAFDDKGWDVVSHFKPLKLPYYLSEVQTRRAMRFAYEVLKGRPQEEYTPLFGGEIIELVFTRQDWAEPVVFNTEKAPLSPEY